MDNLEVITNCGLLESLVNNQKQVDNCMTETQKDL